MNVSKALNQMGLGGWTIRGSSEMSDQSELSRLEMSVNRPSWSELQTAWAAVQLKESAAATYDAALSAGFDTGLGFIMSVSQYAQGRLSVMKSGIDLLVKKSMATGSTPVPVWDKNAVKHMITVDQFETIFAAYTVHCLSIEP